MNKQSFVLIFLAIIITIIFLIKIFKVDFNYNVGYDVGQLHGHVHVNDAAGNPNQSGEWTIYSSAGVKYPPEVGNDPNTAMCRDWNDPEWVELNTRKCEEFGTCQLLHNKFIRPKIDPRTGEMYRNSRGELYPTAQPPLRSCSSLNLNPGEDNLDTTRPENKRRVQGSPANFGTALNYTETKYVEDKPEQETVAGIKESAEAINIVKDKTEQEEAAQAEIYNVSSSIDLTKLESSGKYIITTDGEANVSTKNLYNTLLKSINKSKEDLLNNINNNFVQGKLVDEPFNDYITIANATTEINSLDNYIDNSFLLLKNEYQHPYIRYIKTKTPVGITVEEEYIGNSFSRDGTPGGVVQQQQIKSRTGIIGHSSEAYSDKDGVKGILNMEQYQGSPTDIYFTQKGDGILTMTLPKTLYTEPSEERVDKKPILDLYDRRLVRSGLMGNVWGMQPNYRQNQESLGQSYASVGVYNDLLTGKKRPAILQIVTQEQLACSGNEQAIYDRHLRRLRLNWWEYVTKYAPPSVVSAADKNKYLQGKDKNGAPLTDYNIDVLSKDLFEEKGWIGLAENAIKKGSDGLIDYNWDSTHFDNNCKQGEDCYCKCPGHACADWVKDSHRKTVPKVV